MKFSSYDSPFMTNYRLLVDYILLGLLWIVACLPVITFGAATTAMLLTAEISLRKDEGKLFVTFWKHFGKEFKEATILWLIQILLLAVLTTNVWLLNFNLFPEILEIVIFAASVVVFCWIQLWLAYLSKFEDNVKTVLGNTFFMTMNNLGITVLLSLVIAVTVLAAVAAYLLVPPVLLLVPGAFILSYTAILRKLFSKYIPETEPASSDETE